MLRPVLPGTLDLDGSRAMDPDLSALGLADSVPDVAEALHTILLAGGDHKHVDLFLRTAMPNNTAAYLSFFVKTKQFGFEPLLNVAAHLNKEKVVRRMLQEGLDVNVHGNKGYTALIHASSLGADEVVRLMLACGADANYHFDFKREQLTPLGACLRHANGSPACPHTAVARRLLSEGVHVRTTAVGEGEAVQPLLARWHLWGHFDNLSGDRQSELETHIWRR